ncbi:TPA: hypothetical protein QDB19_002982 [Burkholderia vietnamiensis]|nr:hypothetical protein [Burkholderia vietnamiensis]
MKSQFIELNRGFEAFRADEPDDVVAYRSYALNRTGTWGWLTWEDLLKHRLVIVLGEPGSGKSEELKAQRQKRAESFLLGLERLVNEPVAHILSEDEMERFRRWQRGDGDALFLLDAVDESKLRHDDDFAYAIERLSKEIGPALSRCRFVVTSRVSEWRAETDLRMVMERLLAKPPELKLDSDQGTDAESQTVDIAHSAPNEPAVVVAVLQSLTPSQVRLFVEQRGAPDGAEFLAALQKSNTFAFAGRPLDVTHLYSYWKENRQLNSLTGVVEFMVNKLLAEVASKEKLDPLQPAAAREGAEYLAAAALLCKNLKFSIPDEGHFVDDVRLSPEMVLPETWKPEERRALMNRALFDSASRGALAFHHRSHIEYLTARWVERVMAHNCSFEAMTDLLFAEVDGKTTLRASLAPVAAWLVTEGLEPWRLRLAELILQVAPEIHLQHGDPAALPLSYRRQVLAHIARKYEDRKHLGIHVSPDALSRLADAGLADDINAYLSDDRTSDDLKSDLLMVVWEGGLVDCVLTALELFSRPSTTATIRSYCALAVRFSGTADHQQALGRLALRTDGLSNAAIGNIFESLYPHNISVDGALGILQKANNVDRYNTDLQNMVGRHLTESIRPNDAVPFLQGFLAMIRKPPLTERTQISTEYHWVMPLIPLCLASALKNWCDSHEATDTVLDSILLIDDWLLNGHLESIPKVDYLGMLRQQLKFEYGLRRALFWRRFDLLERPIRLEMLPLYRLNPYNGLAPLHAGDVDWLLADVEQKEDPEAQVIAMTLLLQVLRESNISKLRLAIRLRRVLAAPLLRAILMRHLWGSLSFPVTWRWHKHFKYKLLQRWWWSSRRRAAMNVYYTTRNRVWLLTHLSAIRAGAHPFVLARMTDVMRSDGGTRFSAANWDSVSSKWGKTIASNVAVGCTNVWRQYMPQYPHERAERNSIDQRVIVGLIGLQTLWMRGQLNFALLDAHDVERVVRYACGELNGLPEWFVELSNSRPVQVQNALAEPIACEFRYPETLEHVSDVVAKLGAAPIATVAATSALLQALDAGDPQNAGVLDQVFSALLRAPDIECSSVRTLAPKRVCSYKVGHRGWALWMTTWLNVDAPNALVYLQSALHTEPPEGADSAMETLCSHLSGQPGRGSGSVRRPFLEPMSLRILMPLVYAHIRPENDIDRTNHGVYSPIARDNAQDFRERLWEALRSDESGEADTVLRSFVEEERFRNQRDRILSILDERQGKLADPTAWKAQDVRTFAEFFRHEPRSDYQLYRLVSRLIGNVKGEVEKSENATNRKQVRDGDLEEDFQGFLARKIDEQSMKWFSTTRESEVDLGQRPDIRVERTGMNALPIEVKLANLRHWTVAKLLEGLENQLVGQYLRPTRVGFGIYVVGTTSPSRRWQLHDGRYIDFNELVSVLQSRASELVTERSNQVHGLEVVGIDFSDPRDVAIEAVAPADSGVARRRGRRQPSAD